MTEQELVQRAQKGDEDSFARLMGENETRIYNLTLRMTGNEQDALDLAQEAFFNAWKGLKFFKGDSSFSTWVYRLATNACIDHLRRKKRRQDISVSMPVVDEEDDRPPDIPDERYAPEQVLERKQLRQAVTRGLEQLSAEHRQVLIMRELDGLSYQEIGRLLGLEAGTVKSRIARARLALRKILVETGNFPPGPSS
ncbi:MAG: sigma-70 family RNA polymerase sigma factor [Oscillospiraceae bacterium]|nr:sigma-70 family RNA polymerase sigma factor [Oscillospiraceae bacterium]